MAPVHCQIKLQNRIKAVHFGAAVHLQQCRVHHAQVKHARHMALASSLTPDMPTDAMRVQQRSLLTYISRIYFPFVVREPELGFLDGMPWAVWRNSSPHMSAASTSVKLGLALVLPTLRNLAMALESVEDIIWQSGVCDNPVSRENCSHSWLLC